MNGDFRLYDLLVRRADLDGGATAIVDRGERTTYKGLIERCHRFSSGLRDRNIKAGDRIAIMSGNSTDFMALLGAASANGVIAVLINTRLNDEEIAFIIRDTEPRLVVGDHANFPNAGRVVSACTRSMPCLVMDDLLGEASSPNCLFPDGTTTSVIIHTAAVGGIPRGAVLSHGNLLIGAYQLLHLLRLDHRDSYLGMLPLFHIGGLAMTVAALMAGGKTVMMERFLPPIVPTLMEEEKVTFSVTFPPMLAAVLDTCESQKRAPECVRLWCGVDAPTIIERYYRLFPHALFYSIYGQTEAMPVSGGEFRTRPGSIGKPAPLTRVAIMDDFDQPVATGQTAEICVRSPSVFQGYWRRPEDSAFACRSGWHHTGDLGRLDAEGFLWYGGRKPEKELIKTGGENVFPAEVEKVLLTHEAVEEACVIGVPDEHWGEAVKAVCVLKKGWRVMEDELSAFVASRIARYKKPKYIVFVDVLPKNTDGTIDRIQVKKSHGSAAP